MKHDDIRWESDWVNGRLVRVPRKRERLRTTLQKCRDADAARSAAPSRCGGGSEQDDFLNAQDVLPTESWRARYFR
jgi:hypothetical protein